MWNGRFGGGFDIGLAMVSNLCNRYWVRGASAVLLAAGLAAAMEAWAQGAARSIEVELADYRFAPRIIEVTAGEPVELVLSNGDIFTPHNLTLSAPGAGIDIDVDVQPGNTVSVSFTPDRPGRYEFYCDKKLLFLKSHRQRGMEGVLVVKAR